MVKVIQAVNVIDSVADCKPIVSTIKNISIILYRLIHKVDRVANPVNASWKDDIKIHMLTKSTFEIITGLVPFYGNIACLVVNIFKIVQPSDIALPQQYLLKAICLKDEKEGYQLTAKLLKRYPDDYTEKELRKALSVASEKENIDVCNLILNSSPQWSQNFVLDLLKTSKNKGVLKLLLDKYSTLFTKQELHDVINVGSYGRPNLEKVKFLLDYYSKSNPNYPCESLLLAIQGEHKNYTVGFILKNYPDIDSKTIGEALKIALRDVFCNNEKTHLAIQLLDYCPQLEEKYIIDALINIPSHGNSVEVVSLLISRKPRLASSQITDLITNITGNSLEPNKKALIQTILQLYPEFSSRDAAQLLLRFCHVTEGRGRLDEGFEWLLNQLSNLQAEDAQELLNTLIFKKNAIHCATLLQRRFPGLQIINPEI